VLKVFASFHAHLCDSILAIAGAQVRYYAFERMLALTISLRHSVAKELVSGPVREDSLRCLSFQIAKGLVQEMRNGRPRN